MTTGLSLNLKKIKIMVFQFNQQNNASFQITCGDEPIQEEMNVKFLGLETDKMNWKKHIEFMLPKLNSVCYVITCLKHYSTIRTLKMVHYAYFHSAMMYGIILQGNSIDSNKVFFSKREL